MDVQASVIFYGDL